MGCGGGALVEECGPTDGEGVEGKVRAQTYWEVLCMEG